MVQKRNFSFLSVLKLFFSFEVVTVLILFSGLLIFSSSGCSSRNLRRGVTSQSFKPKSYNDTGRTILERRVSHTTRTEDPEAGVESAERAAPAVSKDFIFVGSETVGVEALHRGTLGRKWKLNVKNGVSSRLLLQDNALYFGANDGFFYAVNADTGAVLWRYETHMPVVNRATLVTGGEFPRILFAASDEIVHCLNATNGQWLWHYKRSQRSQTAIRGNSVPLVLGDRVIVGFSDGYTTSLGLKDGNLQWETKIHNGNKFQDVDAQAVLDPESSKLSEGEQKIFMPSYDGGLYVLSVRDGHVFWHADVGGSRQVQFDGKEVYVPSSDGHVYALDKDTGKRHWSFELDLGTPTEIVLNSSYLAFGSSRQYFYAIRKGDGSLAYRQNIGLRSGFTSAPVNFENEIYLLSNAGTLMSYRWNL